MIRGQVILYLTAGRFYVFSLNSFTDVSAFIFISKSNKKCNLPNRFNIGLTNNFPLFLKDVMINMK